MGAIVRGNDELGFFLREARGDRELAETCSFIHYRECPLRCPIFSKDARMSWEEHIKRYKPFRVLLDHILKVHKPVVLWYENEDGKEIPSGEGNKRAHSLSVGILQQLVIYQARKKRDNARGVAIYKLMSEYNLSLRALAYMLDRGETAIANLAADGLMIEKQNNMPVWLKNVLS